MKRHVIRFSLIVLTVGLVAFAAGRANAQEKHIEILSYSFGLAPGDSLVATLFNAAESGQPAGGRTFGEPVTWTYTVTNTSGAVILERNLTIPENQFRSIRVTYDELMIAGGPGTVRKQVGIRSKIWTSPLWDLRQHAVATLELVDSTGRTRVGVKDGQSNTIFFGEGYSPQAGDLVDDFLIHVAPGQSVWFSAVNLEGPDAGGRTEPISMQLKAYDKDGNVIGGSDEVAIPSGQFRTVRLDYEDFATPVEPDTGSKEIRTKPLWGFRSRTRLPVAVTLEIVDNRTGRTTHAYETKGVIICNNGVCGIYQF